MVVLQSGTEECLQYKGNTDQTWLFLQGSTEDDLPEVPIGTVRLCHLEPNAAHDIDEPDEQST